MGDCCMSNKRNNWDADITDEYEDDIPAETDLLKQLRRLEKEQSKKIKELEQQLGSYKVAAKGKDLEFALGYSHPINFIADEGITFKIDSPTEITVVGINKQLVGETAAKIQKLRKSDPYKGKGLHLEER